MSREQRLIQALRDIVALQAESSLLNANTIAKRALFEYHAASADGPGDASAYDKPHPAPDEYWYPNSAVWEMLRDKNAARAHTPKGDCRACNFMGAAELCSYACTCTPKAAESGEFPEAEFPMDSFTSWLGGQTFDDQMKAEIAIAQWAWRKALASRPKAEGQEFWILRDAVGETQDVLVHEPTRHTLSDFFHVRELPKGGG